MLQWSELRSVFSPQIKDVCKSICSSSSLSIFCFPRFQLPKVNRSPRILNFLNHRHHLLLTSNCRHRHSPSLMIQGHPKQMILLTYHQKVNSSLTLGHNAYVIHLTSSHHIGILSPLIVTKRRVSTVQ